MAEIRKAKGSKKGRKIGRNQKWCQAYRNRGQRERNKLRRLKPHLKRRPADNCAKMAADRCRRT